MLSSPVPSRKGEILNAFAIELDSLIKTPNDVKKTIRIMEKLVSGSSMDSMEIPEEEKALVDRVIILRNMMNEPNVGSVNTIAIKALRREMQGMVADRVEQLKKLQTYKEVCQYMLPDLSPDAAQSFITDLEGFNYLSSEKALVKGVLRSVIRESAIDQNEELEQALMADQTLYDYICGIACTLVASDAVLLKGEGPDNSPQRYHRSFIERWLEADGTDPSTREPRTLDNIVPDPQAEQVIRNKILSWLDSKTGEAPYPFERFQVLNNKSLLLAAAIAYPQVKKKYETTLEKLHDTQKTMEEVEVFAEEVIGLFASLTEVISSPIEQLLPFCCPYIENFIRQAAEKVRDGVSLQEVVHELEGKTSVFTEFFHRIDFASLPLVLKEGALARIGKAISETAPLVQLEDLFFEYMDSVQEEKKARNACPGCIMGSKEWMCLGVVGKMPPFSKDILEALNQPSPSDPQKKAWQTGLLVLIPEMVDGKPLTLNRVGELMKKYFPGNEAGYRSMSPDVADKYGDVPVQESRWVVIEKGVLPSSDNKNFKQQKAMIHSPYQASELLPTTVSIVLDYLSSESQERLLDGEPGIHIRCTEMIESSPVTVACFRAEGLIIDETLDAAFTNCVVMPQRNLGRRIS